MAQLKEIEYRNQTIKVFYGSHMGDHFYCTSKHLKSKHNIHHINGGWETIDIAVNTIKNNIDKWLNSKINTIEDLSKEINKALIYHEEYDATIDINTLKILIDKFNS